MVPDITPMRDLWSLTWPQMLMMVFHFLIGFTDVWAAGRIGGQVQAGMGMINQLLFFFLVVAIALANGSVAAISQSMGAKLPKRVRRYIGLSLEIGLGAGFFIVIGGYLTRGVLLSLLQVPDEVRPVTAYFLDVFLVLLPIYYLFIVTNAVFRAQKLVKVPMMAMAGVTVVNIIGDLGFGLGWFGLPAFGYQGLAWATVASVSCGVAFNLWQLRRHGQLALKIFPPVRWIKCAFPYLFKVAWPGGVMQLVWHSAYLAVFAVVASLPEENVSALAGMAAGMRVESGLFLPGFAFNMTASIVVGEALGKGSPQEAKHLALKILAVGVAVISLLAVALYFFLEPVCAFVAPEAKVQAQTVDYMVWNLLAIPFTLTSMILAGALAGAGATVYNLLTFGVSAWGVRLPVAYVLGHLVLESPSGVWISMLVSQMFQSALTLYLFLFRDWSRFAMRKTRNNNGNRHAA